MTTEGTLLLSPTAEGCAWVIDGRDWPACQQPVAYRLTCSATGMTADACVAHTAQMRATHPDWISEVRDASQRASSATYATETGGKGDPAAVDGGAS
jgi:hypothetical protein